MINNSVDYYNTLEEAKKHHVSYLNPRYSTFTQTHYTAGDEDQFFSNVIKTSPKLIQSRKEEYLPSITPPEISPLYTELKVEYLYSTFRYLFHKFKKGIFVSIRNNTLSTFLPFSKANFVNEWSDKIKIDPKFKDLVSFIAYSEKLCGWETTAKNINQNVSTWYCNNCLLRTEFPICEGDTGITCVHDMLIELCKTRKVPDIDFFVNRRDFPLLKNDKTEPYNHIFGKNQMLVSHSYDKYFPILSMTTTPDFADIPIPTTEDWVRISTQEGKYFEDFGDYNYTFDTPWKLKKNKAVFRGSSTGSGTSVETNMRLKLASMHSNSLLDVGITKWNSRPRKEENKEYLTLIDPHDFDFGLIPELSPEEQSKYKYIINVEGHVSAYRLSLELSMNSVILLVNCEYKLWYSNVLKPLVHYIPIKHDLSDLIEKVKWCKKHDKECEKIAKNAKKFYDTYLVKNGMLNYLSNLLYTLRKKMGNYEIVNEDKILEKRMKKLLPIPTASTSKIYLENYKWVRDATFFNQLSQYPVNIGETIMTRGNTIIKDCDILGKKIIGKQNHQRYYNAGGNLFEYFVGRKCINKLFSLVPNFVYTFAKNDDTLFLEKIVGITFENYLSSSAFNFKEYLFILGNLALVLEISQREYFFVHYDLFPWNIILKREKVRENYNLFPYSYSISTEFYPIILDYDKSSFVYKNFTYGGGLYKNFSSIIDILCILYSSLHIILCNQCLNKKDLNSIFILANFVCGGEYHISKFENVRELKDFLLINKKYDVIMNKDRKELENKTPIDFLNYIVTNFGKINIDRKKNIDQLTTRYSDESLLKRILENEDTLNLEEIIKQKPKDVEDYYKIYLRVLRIIFTLENCKRSDKNEDITQLKEYLSNLSINITSKDLTNPRLQKILEQALLLNKFSKIKQKYIQLNKSND